MNPERSAYQLRNEVNGLTEDILAHVPEGETMCGSLDLTMHGFTRAVDHLAATAYGGQVLAEVAAPSVGPDDIEAEAALMFVAEDVGALAEELTTIAGNVRRGVAQCPGKCPGGACGLSPSQQYEAFWRQPPPMFAAGKRVAFDD